MNQKLLRRISHRPAFLALALVVLGMSQAWSATWYVDKAVTGGLNNGSSWANAWTSFSVVVWGASGVKAGDTLFISGGSTSKTYTETWTVGASGTVASPIRIALDAANPAHNGLVIFDFNASGDSGTATAITCSRNYVTFDGNVNGACHLVIANLRNILNRSVGIGIYGSPVTGVVIDHVASTNCNNPLKLIYASGVIVRNCQLMQVRGDAAIAMAGSSGSWDSNLVVSNNVELLFNSARPAGSVNAYVGPDGIQCGSGMTIRGNKFKVMATSVYTSDQHTDTIQATGNYLKVYGNEFVNVGDSVFDFDCYANANPHDVWIYNNLFRITDNVDTYPEYFRFYASFNSCASIVNFKILNNTFVDNNFQYRVVRFDMFNANPTASGNEIKNNIFYNCGGGNASAPVIYVQNSSGFTAGSFAIDGNVYYQAGATPYISYLGTSYTAANWVSTHEPSGKTVAPQFASYTAFANANDFHLRSTDTAAKDSGLSLASYFSTDRDDIARPQGAAWDIGAYEYGSGSGGSTNLPPVVSVVSQNVADADPVLSGIQVLAGASVQYSGSASDPNGNPLTWQWIYTLNGGLEVVHQNGTGVVNPASFNYGIGSVGSTYVWKLRVSDGLTSGEAQLTVGVMASPATQGLTFEAESGVVTVPFVVTGGYISQSSQTGLANGGRATYNFVLTNAGNYVVQALVDAPNNGANSLFLNVDAEPLDPSMVWQIPITTGFENRVVSWQGAGTFDNPQFVPKIFNLTAGPHQLILRGREADTRVDRLVVLALPQPPRNLRVSSP